MKWKNFNHLTGKAECLCVAGEYRLSILFCFVSLHSTERIFVNISSYLIIRFNYRLIFMLRVKFRFSGKRNDLFPLIINVDSFSFKESRGVCGDGRKKGIKKKLCQ